MDRKRRSSCDQATTSSPHSSKRQKSSISNSAHAILRKQYTIAWISALPIEMAAARAMLDKIDTNLPQDDDDKNTYMLGSIGSHKIVIACLPIGQYGNNNATSVVTNLRRSFPSIKIGFMVGIGGGVPTMADLRLGDIVVGIRVMPYDLGKVTEGGKIQRTGSPRFPDQALLTAVSSIRAKHLLEPSQVPSILADMTAKYPGFSRRVANNPKIHYGAIASGNNVMKDSVTRDKVARDLDIICFEMEAAGLMDILPCLPIRGICDYSDSHKSKEWQEYAAATAASYAKELIEILPANDRTLESLDIHNSPSPNQASSPKASPNRRELLLESLKFEQIDSRKISIKKASLKTCRWFLRHPEYLKWLDPQNRAHRGFLWIRGKPGAGKSTIMKFIYEQMKKKDRHKHAITASFFFHARGEDLQKSIPGMYRSLLLQLLEGYPDLQEVLDDTDLVPRSQTGCPSLNVLKDIFYNAVSNLGERTFTCFIDALDECDEQQVMEMVHSFEELAESCEGTGSHLQICFSSRHYPYIQLRHGIELTLEHQQGHSEDLSNYIQSNLRVTGPALAEELRSEMLEKAAGVFLWVVLVVDILNKESRRGGLALQKRLAEVPSGLSDLFKDILTRDTEKMEDLLLSVLWILYAKRPLRPEEYCHALWSGLVQKDLVDAEMPDTGPDSSDRIRSYVTASSKGLAEIPKVKSPTVQFIHESVKDFLIKDRGLQALWPDFKSDLQSRGHERLKQCCSTYINHDMVHACISSNEPATKSDGSLEVKEQFPFLEYASQNVLYHSDGAAQAIPQTEFLSQTSTLDWASTINSSEKFEIRRYSPTASLIYILADKGFSELIRTWLPEHPATDIRGERYEYPLFAALANGHKDAVAALLGLNSSIRESVDLPKGFGSKTGFTGYKGRTLLTWAAQEGQMNVLKPLLRKGTDIDETDQQYYTSLMRASEAGHHAVVAFLIKEGARIDSAHSRRAMSLSLKNGHVEIVKLLIEANADLDLDPHSLQVALNTASKKGFEPMAKYLLEEKADVHDPKCYNALCIASENGHLAIMKLLLERGVPLELDATNGGPQSALVEASNRGDEAMVRFLVQQGARLEAPDAEGRTALTEASNRGHEAIVRFLVHQGAKLEAPGGGGRTALIEASNRGDGAMVRFLVQQGARLETPDTKGRTALTEASNRGHEAIVRFLVQQGADIESRDNNSSTPLHLAASGCQSRCSLIEVLINKGADVNVRDGKGLTPLHLVASEQYFVPSSVPQLLIDNGADVNARDVKGLTPLHLVASNQYCDPNLVAEVLIDNGADVHARDREGSTPLHLAINRSQTPNLVVSILVKNGADVDARNHEGDTPRGLVEKRGLPSYHPLVSAIEGSWDRFIRGG
ncbi:hypothetical protein CDV36_000691 [Fusarium kuroshium]|uniref:Uncharacterized protein n=1 Tax=Fusarium kuroshium TaxID=2010991 RepID=A0A3M2SQ63_9HYPO|nr:hypothetical protein CDV36_000691 [Fusarium kuroshium]